MACAFKEEDVVGTRYKLDGPFGVLRRPVGVLDNRLLVVISIEEFFIAAAEFHYLGVVEQVYSGADIIVGIIENIEEVRDLRNEVGIIVLL